MSTLGELKEVLRSYPQDMQIIINGIPYNTGAVMHEAALALDELERVVAVQKAWLNLSCRPITIGAKQ